MRKKLLLLLILLPSFILFIPSFDTFAEELPPGVVIGDEKGIRANKDGEYFVDVKNVMPGQSWKKTISLLNVEKDVPYQLTMLIEPPKVSGKLDLSEAIQMKIIYGGKTVYEGPASGTSPNADLQKKALDLGVFRGGDSRAMEVNYSISGKYTKDDFEMKNTMENVWVFTAVKSKKPTDPTEPTKTKPTGPVPTGSSSTGTPPLGPKEPPTKGILPITGEDIKQIMMIAMIGMFGVVVALAIWKKKSKEQKVIKRRRR